MFKILASNRNFRYLWLGQLVSSLGDRLTQMGVLAFLMLSANDKGDKVAIITFFNLLPFLLFGPLFGALVDKYSRKNLMIIADNIKIARYNIIKIVDDQKKEYKPFFGSNFIFDLNEVSSYK